MRPPLSGEGKAPTLGVAGHDSVPSAMRSLSMTAAGPVPTLPTEALTAGRRPPAPPASSAAVRRRMVGQRRRDTTPELAVRRALYSAGLRYRVEYAALPGMRRRVDVAFPRVRLALLVDGCWWHGCPDHGHDAKTNTEWWATKLRRNWDRDRDTDERLRSAGWRVIRAWEHEEPGAVADRVRSELKQLGWQ